MLIIDCVECGYANKSATAICNRKGCPLMTEPSPFPTYIDRIKNDNQQEELRQPKERLG